MPSTRDPLLPRRIEPTPMDYRRLGNTGLTVSRICLGCMSYGDPDRARCPASRRAGSGR